MKWRFRFRLFTSSAKTGSQVQLRVYTHVREDAIQLYGFKTARERELFLQLISVNGVGPGLAIKLLSGMNADEMIASIRTNNLARLSRFPESAAKPPSVWSLICATRSRRLSSPALEEEFAAKAAAAGRSTSPDAMRDDAMSALVNLGYQTSGRGKSG